ncbi:CLUMA_CG007419, isoform A [Clunio marinus]|uniref:CLUMA_CG007419, isoform A n=1 Tax=Clunio marinus TaxID=568069 RepID=A0A1J1I2S6_9DIPT|nr:CLUMA_CG007419, isoform A [Clunio marinus]
MIYKLKLRKYLSTSQNFQANQPFATSCGIMSHEHIKIRTSTVLLSDGSLKSKEKQLFILLCK